MKFLTDFGDSALLLPLSAVMLLWLLAARSLRAALWWAVTLAFLGGVMGSLKVLFFACPPAPGVVSPSGHTAFSMTVYGCLAVILAADRRRLPPRMAILAAGWAFAAAIAFSRVILDMHTIPETIIGYAIGAIAVGIFAYGYRRSGGGRRHLALLLVAVATSLAILHGSQLNPEHEIHALSGLLGLRRLFCPS